MDTKQTGTLLDPAKTQQLDAAHTQPIKPSQAGVTPISSVSPGSVQGGLVNLVLEDHARFRRMFERFKSNEGTLMDDWQGKFEQMQAMIEAIAMHSSDESRTLYPTFLDKVGKEGRLAYDKLLLDNQVDKELLEFLDKNKPSSQEDWNILNGVALKWIASEEAHIQDEERNILPKLNLLLSESEQRYLGEQWRQRKHTAPLKPHPEGPSGGLASKVMHPIVGAMDRMSEGIKSLVGADRSSQTHPSAMQTTAELEASRGTPMTYTQGSTTAARNI